jgi:hypothetical protein
MKEGEKGFCNSCERDRIGGKYWPCQIPRDERANYDKCHAEENGFPDHKYVPIPGYKEKKGKEGIVQRGKSKKEIRREILEEREKEKAKKNLEAACEILGWDEKDNIDRAMHIKTLIKACKSVEKLEGYNFNEALGLMFDKLEKNRYLKSPFREIYSSIQDYIRQVREGKLSDLEGNRGNIANLRYPAEIGLEILTIMR